MVVAVVVVVAVLVVAAVAETYRPRPVVLDNKENN